MVRRMFEEYKFFPGFPEKELRITGQLFGGIIDQGLVPYVVILKVDMNNAVYHDMRIFADKCLQT